MCQYAFCFNSRLGIFLPELNAEWEQYSAAEQDTILQQWEIIRSRIPDRIIELEEQIRKKQERLNQEEHFPTSCQINSEIAELASSINDLNIWYRVNQEMEPDKLHG